MKRCAVTAKAVAAAVHWYNLKVMKTCRETGKSYLSDSTGKLTISQWDHGARLPSTFEPNSTTCT